MSAKKKIQFGAMPIRALKDPHLSGADLRVLGAISYFDRFSKNGTGCYATQETLAAMTGMHVTTVSTCQKKLREMGYVLVARQENRRRLHYKVIYDTLPNEQVSGDADTLPNGKQSDADDTLPDGYPDPPDTFSGGHTNRSCETEPNKSCETGRNSPEGAPALRADAPVSNLGAHVAQIERLLKSGRPKEMTRRQWSAWLLRTRDLLDEIHADGEHGDPVAGMAYRLLQEYDFESGLWWRETETRT